MRFNNREGITPNQALLLMDLYKNYGILSKTDTSDWTVMRDEVNISKSPICMALLEILSSDGYKIVVNRDGPEVPGCKRMCVTTPDGGRVDLGSLRLAKHIYLDFIAVGDLHSEFTLSVMESSSKIIAIKIEASAFQDDSVEDQAFICICTEDAEHRIPCRLKEDVE